MDLLVFMSTVDAMDWTEMVREMLVDVSHCQGGEKGFGLLAVTFIGDYAVGLGD